MAPVGRFLRTKMPRPLNGYNRTPDKTSYGLAYKLLGGYSTSPLRGSKRSEAELMQ